MQRGSVPAIAARTTARTTAQLHIRTRVLLTFVYREKVVVMHPTVSTWPKEAL